LILTQFLQPALDSTVKLAYLFRSGL